MHVRRHLCRKPVDGASKPDAVPLGCEKPESKSASLVVPPGFTDPLRTRMLTGTPVPAGTVSARSVAFGALETPRPDAREVIEQYIQRISALAGAGEKPLVVFDIDNTLVDTRPRTLAAVRAFGQAQGVARLANVTRDEVGLDGLDTAKRLGLGSGPLTDALVQFVSDFFWKSENFLLDVPIQVTIDLAKRAKAAGAEVLYLTGRENYLQATTLAQLSRAGLPDVDPAHVLCKPDSVDNVASPTMPFKLAELRKQLALGRHLIWFLTEGARDIRFLQDKLADDQSFADFGMIQLNFPVNDDRFAVKSGTPLLAMS